MHSVVDAAKADLRTEVRRLLVQNLVSSAPRPLAVTSSSTVPHSDAQNVAKFLHDHGYHYSLSVFMAEAKLNPDQDFTAGPSTSMGTVTKPRQTVEPNLKILAEQIWQSVDRKFQIKLNHFKQEKDAQVAEDINKLKIQYKEKLADKENQMAENFAIKIEQVNNKERDMVAMLSKEKTAQLRQLHNQREEMVAQVRELELRRIQLQELEDQFQRQQETDKRKLLYEREQLALREKNVGQIELQIDSRLEEAKEEIRKEERYKYVKSLRELAERERELRDGIRKMEDKVRLLIGQKKNKDDREGKIRDLEIVIAFVKDWIVYEKHTQGC